MSKYNSSASQMDYVPVQEFVDDKESDLRPFPAWCIKDPVVDIQMAEEIKQTWTKIKTGECHGYKRYCALADRGETLLPVGVVSATESQSHDHSATREREGMDRERAKSLDGSGMSRIEGSPNDAVSGDYKAEEQKMLSKKPDKSKERGGDKVHKDGSKQSHTGSQSSKKPKLPERMSSKEEEDDGETKAQHFNVKSPTQFFYDNFYNNLFALNQRYRLMFSDDLQKQGKMLAQLIGFIVHTSDKLGDKEFIKSAFNMASVHNKRTVKAEDYDLLGQALLLALKVTLGNDYTEKVKTAWITVYSALMVGILPFVAQEKRVYIKTASMIPGLFGLKPAKKPEPAPQFEVESVSHPRGRERQPERQTCCCAIL